MCATTGEEARAALLPDSNRGRHRLPAHLHFAVEVDEVENAARLVEELLLQEGEGTRKNENRRTRLSQSVKSW